MSRMQGNSRDMTGKAAGILKEKIMRVLREQPSLSDSALKDVIDEEIFKYGQDIYLPLPVREKLHRRLFDSFRRLDILQEEGVDVDGMAPEELEEASEVFPLPDGKYLIVEG